MWAVAAGLASTPVAMLLVFATAWRCSHAVPPPADPVCLLLTVAALLVPPVATVGLSALGASRADRMVVVVAGSAAVACAYMATAIWALR